MNTDHMMNDDHIQKESILMVDDNPTNLQVLFKTLEGMGCRMLVAKDGQTALTIAGKKFPDLILLDIMMPGMDGYEVCRRLKSQRSTQHIPVIFLSALSETEDKVKGLNIGAVDYITKPFQPEEVIARVNTHLTIHRLKSEVETQKDQLEQELKTVSDLQCDLLPEKLPDIDGHELAVYYETSRYAGGDYYDFSEMPDNRFGILMADAEGHSAPAAVRMAMTRALFSAYPSVPSDPADVLIYLNRHLCKVVEPSFITALYIVYDTNQQLLQMANAGHPPPLIYRTSDGAVTTWSMNSVFPMGIDLYDHVPVSEKKLEKGDRLLLYTDGVTERFNPAGEIYGEQRLIKQFEAGSDGNAQDILDGIIYDVEKFADGQSSDDDQALLVIIVEQHPN
jgi:sigma-B regulation protein RsbU (phosphoserine phosphatase)